MNLANTQKPVSEDVIPFADMSEDDVGDIASPAELKAAAQANAATYGKLDRKATGREEKLFSEPCPKCGGTGIYYGHSRYGSTCFKCDGKKVLLFKRPKAERDAAKLKRIEKKARIEQQNLETVEAQYPQLKEWWTDSTFEFAVSLRDAATRFGALSDKQAAAALKCVEKFNEAKKAREEKHAAEAARVAALPVINVQHIADAFTRARDSGIKRPKLRLFSGAEPFEFSRAPDTGKNPGAIYVNSGEGQYLGKVASGKFLKSYDCSAESETEVLKVCSDPAQAAIAYGKQFGVCSACGRELSDPVSIERGIGPICADRFFG